MKSNELYVTFNFRKIKKNYFDGLIELFILSGVFSDYQEIRFARFIEHTTWTWGNDGYKCINLHGGVSKLFFEHVPGLYMKNNSAKKKGSMTISSFILDRHVGENT